MNAWCFLLASKSREQADRLRACDCVYADGQAIVWAARWLGAPLPERVNAGDFIEQVLRGCAAAGHPVFLLGGWPGLAEQAAARWQQAAPGLRITGAAPGYWQPGSAEELALWNAIEAGRPRLLLIGMGSPRQEEFMLQNRERLARAGVRAAWCVGALMEYNAGERWRAPVWARRCGLEWLVRLALEPRRLARRYLLGNPEFIARVLLRRRVS